MAWETRIGLLVGLAFIVCFAVILSRHNNGTPSQDSFAGSHWIDRIDQSPASTDRIERAARRIVYPEVNEDALPAPIEEDPGFERIAEEPSKDSQDSVFSPQLLADAVRAGVQRWMATDEASAPVEPESVLADASDINDSPLMLAASTNANRQEPVRPERVELPTYTVKDKDSLYKIAMNEYGRAGQKLIQQLYEANRHQMSSPDSLKVGQIIVLPEIPGTTIRRTSASKEPASKKPAVEKPAPSQPSTKVAPEPRKSKTAEEPQKSQNWRWYVVQKNDILGVIAQKELGTSKRWKEIYELNKDRFPDPGKIQSGTRIKIPTTGDREA